MASLMVGRVERAVVYAGLTVAIGLGLGWRDASPAVAQNGSAPASVTIRVATVDILSLAEKLIATEKYRSGRETNAASLSRPLQSMLEDLKALEAKYGALAADSPERSGLQQQYQQKSQAFQQAQQQAQLDDERFKATQVAEAYRIVVAAADQMGQELGYGLVIASRSGSPVIRSDNVPGAVQEMIARPVIRGDAADDLTARLLAQLGLKDAEPVKAAPVETPAPK